MNATSGQSAATDARRGYEPHRGQARIAYRLADAYAGQLMYVRGLGWHVWDGRRWAEDDRDLAKNAVLAVLREALAESIDDKDLRADVRKCESASGINGVLDIASALPRLRAGVDDLDADPFLLCCSNGTLDLRTRQLREHDPADRITKIAVGAYDPGADPAVWQAFLARILPDDDERAYFQRIVGQGVYGRVREHLFPVLTGTGANGKGTAYGAVRNALGTYSTVVDPAILMAGSRTGGPEMMELRGARLVIGSETGEGRRLDAATMKRLTGGDELTARRLYQEPVTWAPTHQLVYVTNHLPKVKGSDAAIWRRLRVVPFDVVIPADERDPQLAEALELHADAILTWAAAGWFDYLDRGGMDDPRRVTSATDAYRDDSDDVKRFLDAECTSGPGLYARARDLFAAWCRWAESDGAEVLGEKKFAVELDRLGIDSKRDSAGSRRLGIALRDDREEGAV